MGATGVSKYSHGTFRNSFPFDQPKSVSSAIQTEPSTLHEKRKKLNRD